MRGCPQILSFPTYPKYKTLRNTCQFDEGSFNAEGHFQHGVQYLMVMKTTLEGIFPLKRIFAVSQEHLIMTEGLRMTAKDCKSAEDGEICRDEKSSTSSGRKNDQVKYRKQMYGCATFFSTLL